MPVYKQYLVVRTTTLTITTTVIVNTIFKMGFILLPLGTSVLTLHRRITIRPTNEKIRDCDIVIYLNVSYTLILLRLKMRNKVLKLKKNHIFF